jgi:GMP synthase (glutamine-hydrolysing)
MEQNGHSASYTRFYNFDTLPTDISSIDLLIVLGGPQSPTTSKDECAHFDGPAEIEFITKVIAANKKVLGICLGAQLIGEALGAAVEHSPEREIGLYEVKLTEAGKVDKLTGLLDAAFETGHWHGDMPGLTPDAEVLAFSAGCPRQIVRFTPLVYGFQCHFEFTPEAIEGMIANCSDELSRYAENAFVQSAAQLQANNYLASNKMLFNLLNAFENCS